MVVDPPVGEPELQSGVVDASRKEKTFEPVVVIGWQ